MDSAAFPLLHSRNISSKPDDRHSSHKVIRTPADRIKKGVYRLAVFTISAFRLRSKRKEQTGNKKRQACHRKQPDYPHFEQKHLPPQKRNHRLQAKPMESIVVAKKNRNFLSGMGTGRKPFPTGKLNLSIFYSYRMKTSAAFLLFLEYISLPDCFPNFFFCFV